jgi:hypothetical protein
LFASEMARYSLPFCLQFSCKYPYCSIVIKRKQDMSRHEMTHSSERYVLCYLVVIEFLSGSLSKDHMSVNCAAEDSYKRMAWRRILTPSEQISLVSRDRHSSSIATSLGKKPYACDIGSCKAAFADPSTRSRHRKETHQINGGRYFCTVGKCESK